LKREGGEHYSNREEGKHPSGRIKNKEPEERKKKKKPVWQSLEKEETENGITLNGKKEHPSQTNHEGRGLGERSGRLTLEPRKKKKSDLRGKLRSSSPDR